MTPTKEKESFWNLTRKTLSKPYFFVGAVSNFTFFFSQMVVIALTPMRAQFEYKMTPEQGIYYLPFYLNVFNIFFKLKI